MPRTTTFFATVFAVLLSACGGGNSGNPAEASLPPLSGVYRTADGATAEFIADGTFRGPAGLGTFTVDGDRVSIQLSADRQVVATRASADKLVFNRPGNLPLTFFRAGSAVAQSAEAEPLPGTPAKPMPDPTVPLGAYTALQNAETVELVNAAFLGAPLSDDSLARLLGDPTSGSAFERRDRLAREGPALEARLEAARQQRYYRMDVVTASILQEPGQDKETRPRWSLGDTHLALKPYDFERKGFPLVRCLSQSSVAMGAVGRNIHFARTAGPEGDCLLPLADEEVARRLEAGRTSYLNVFVQATLYFFVVEGTPGSLQATLTHADLTLFDPADSSHQTPLTTLAVKL